MDPDPYAAGKLRSSVFWIKASLLTVSLTTVVVFKEPAFSLFRKPKTFKSQIPKQVVYVEKIPETPVAPTKKAKKIYLTFDDGPNKGSKKVLDIVQQERVPVTFFIVGQHITGSAEQQAIFDSLKQCYLVELANHSYSHAHRKYEKFYANPDSVVADFNRCADSMRANISIARMPGRNVWRTDSLRITDIKKTNAAADSLHVKGYTLAGWDLEWHFTPEQELVQSKDELMHQIDSLMKTEKMRTKDNLVILTHDRTFLQAQDSAMLHELIKQIKSEGKYEFSKMNEYPGIAGVD